MPHITPHLWFDTQAEEAANFYVGVFKNSRLGAISYYTTDTPSNLPAGTVLTVEFELDGQKFMALNGGPVFTFNESISFVIECEDQAEIDYYWDKLSADPSAEQCGWLKDKYGVSWQVVPKRIAELMADPDKERSARVMDAVLKMHKLDLAELERVYNEDTN